MPYSTPPSPPGYNAPVARPLRLGILTSHPIQYQAPWFRALARRLDLEVFFAHKPRAAEQGVGFGKDFDWDVDLLSGYRHRFLKNISDRPDVNYFKGCDTPEITDIICRPPSDSDQCSGSSGGFDAFIVMGWYLRSYWQAVRACRQARLPVLVRGDSHLLTPSSWFKRAAKGVIYRRVLNRFDGFLTVGKRNREYLHHYGVPPNRIFFVPHFVDNSWFSTQSRKAVARRLELRAKWGADDSTFVVMFVGKFQQLKRPMDLVCAIDRLRSMGESVRQVMVVFVGSGDLEGELRAKAADLRIKASFAGFKNQSEMPACYASADLLVLPSSSETWGLVVNEAMACGLPAIVSDVVGCAPDLIDAGRTGFTFPVGNIDALSEQISRVVDARTAGHDWHAALAEKMQTYSIEYAVNATMLAIRTTAGYLR